MTEELKEQVDEILGKLESYAELENEIQALKELLASQQKTEQAAETYAEELKTAKAQLEEFNTKLAQEKQERERFTELYQTERKTRRLAEFTDKARAWTFATEVESFAEDLLAIQDQDDELYSRWIQRLDAINEQMKTGELFKQVTVGGDETEGTDPFEREITKVRKERFSELPFAEGYVKAMEIIERDNPELARQYAETH